MYRVNDLLLVTHYDGNTIKRKEYSEEELIKKAKTLMSKPFLIDLTSNLPMISHNFAFRVISLCVNLEDFSMLPFGNDLISGYESKGADYRFLFSYYPKFSSQPQISDSLFLEPLNPFIYYRFVNEIVKMISYLPESLIEDDIFFNSLCKYVIFSTPELCLLKNFTELRTNLVRFIRNECKCKDLKVFDEIFNHCLCSCMYNSELKDDSKPQKIVSEYLHMNSNDLLNKFPNFEYQRDVFHTISYINDRSSMLTTSWVYTSDEIEDDPNGRLREAQHRMNHLANGVSKLGTQNQPAGFIHVFFSLNWNKDSTKDCMEGSFIQIKYKGKHSYSSLSLGSFEFVFPVFNKKKLKIRFRHKSDEKKNIQELVIDKLNENHYIEGNFVVKKPHGQAKFIINAKYYPSIEKSICLVHLFTPEASPKECMDFLIQCTMMEWLNNMDLYPPMKLFSTVIDFALKYGATPSSVFFGFLTKMQLCWTSSGSFLDAFTGILLMCYVMFKQYHITEGERESYNAAIDTLSSIVPKLLINTLSKPDMIEKPAVTPLMIVLSLFYDPSGINQFIQSILQDSVVNIFESVIHVLECTPSTMEANPSIMSLYSCLKSPPTFSNGKNGIPKVSFSPPSILKAAQILLKRTEQLTVFFNSQSIPTFADHERSIRLDFSSLSYRIADSFSHCDQSPNESDTFNFLGVYKQLWKLFGSNPNHSPFILFSPILLRWVSELGPALINWTSQAVKHDSFKIEWKQKKVSSSLGDLFKIFRDTVAFIEQLDLGAGEPDIFLNSYISLCSSSLRLYISILRDLLRNHINKYISIPSKQLTIDGDYKREINLSQFFVIINNMISVHSFWSEFIRVFNKNHPQILQTDEISLGVLKDINESLIYLEKIVGSNIERMLYNLLWSKKKNFVSKKTEMKPSFESDSLILFEETKTYLFSIINDLDSLIIPKIPKAISYIVKGIRNGFLYCLKPFHEIHKPSKFFRLILVFDSIQSDFFDRIHEKGIKYPSKDTDIEFDIIKWMVAQEEIPASIINEIDVDENDIIMNYYKKVILYQKSESSSQKLIFKKGTISVSKDDLNLR